MTYLVESVDTRDDRLSLERKHSVGLYEGLDVGQGLQHEEPLGPGGQSGISSLVSQVGQHLVHLTVI